MIILGITGGTGCGKTTALDAIAALGGAPAGCEAPGPDPLQPNPPPPQAPRAPVPAA